MLTRLGLLGVLTERRSADEFADAAFDVVRVEAKRLKHAIVLRDAQTAVAELHDRQPFAAAPPGPDDDPCDIHSLMVHLDYPKDRLNGKRTIPLRPLPNDGHRISQRACGERKDLLAGVIQPTDQ